MSHLTAPHVPRIAAHFRGTSGRHILLLALLGLVVRLVPAWLVYGSFDVGAWELVVREFRMGHNPYDTGKLNWPPLWPVLLLYSMRLEDVYHLPTHFAVKLVPCVVDAAIGPVLYAWFVRTGAEPGRALRRALWYVLNPIAIATCALQGQFESLPSLFLVLAIIAAARADQEGKPTASAVWLGLAGLAKTWPLVLLPAFLRLGRTPAQKVAFAAIALAPAVIGIAIIYRLDPEATVHNVLTYRGATGNWGLTSFNSLLPPAMAEAWSHITLRGLYVAWLAVYAATWRRGSVGQVAVLGLLTFYVFTSGGGPQYHVWIVGATLLADSRRGKIYTVLATASLSVFYALSPFNGEYFDFVKRSRTPLFWATNLDSFDRLMQAFTWLPLYLYCIWWWFTLLREIRRQPVDDSDAPRTVQEAAAT